MNTYIVKVDSNSQRWYKEDGRTLHRDNGPAVIASDGSKFWYKENMLHRDGGPAIEYSDGSKSWYKNGLLHREGNPAVITNDGRREWWVNGIYGRDGAPSTIEANGDETWYLDGKFLYKKNSNGDIIELPNDNKEKQYTVNVDDEKMVWKLNGVIHRDDGPAVEYFDGTKEWYDNGERITHEEFCIRASASRGNVRPNQPEISIPGVANNPGGTNPT